MGSEKTSSLFRDIGLIAAMDVVGGGGVFEDREGGNDGGVSPALIKENCFGKITVLLYFRCKRKFNEALIRESLMKKPLKLKKNNQVYRFSGIRN